MARRAVERVLPKVDSRFMVAADVSVPGCAGHAGVADTAGPPAAGAHGDRGPAIRVHVVEQAVLFARLNCPHSSQRTLPIPWTKGSSGRSQRRRRPSTPQLAVSRRKRLSRSGSGHAVQGRLVESLLTGQDEPPHCSLASPVTIMRPITVSPPPAPGCPQSPAARRSRSTPSGTWVARLGGSGFAF